MDATTLECFRKQLELLETELRADVEGQAAATAPVQVDSSINVALVKGAIIAGSAFPVTVAVRDFDELTTGPVEKRIGFGTAFDRSR